METKLISVMLDKITEKLQATLLQLIMDKSPQMMTKTCRKLQNAAYSFLICLNGTPDSFEENDIYLNLASIIADYIVKIKFKTKFGGQSTTTLN